MQYVIRYSRFDAKFVREKKNAWRVVCEVLQIHSTSSVSQAEANQKDKFENVEDKIENISFNFFKKYI